MSVVTDRRWWNRETINGRRSSCAHTFKPDRIEIDDDDDDGHYDDDDCGDDDDDGYDMYD